MVIFDGPRPQLCNEARRDHLESMRPALTADRRPANPNITIESHARQLARVGIIGERRLGCSLEKGHVYHGSLRDRSVRYPS